MPTMEEVLGGHKTLHGFFGQWTMEQMELLCQHGKQQAALALPTPTMFGGQVTHQTDQTFLINWLTVNNSDASTIMTEMEGFEDDCGQRCTYESSCGTFNLFDDDNLDTRASSGNINFLLDQPCNWNQYTIQNGDYYAKAEVYWEYISLDAGVINGDQNICPNGDPTTLGSTTPGSPSYINLGNISMARICWLHRFLCRYFWSQFSNI